MKKNTRLDNIIRRFIRLSDVAPMKENGKISAEIKEIISMPNNNIAVSNKVELQEAIATYKEILCKINQAEDKINKALGITSDDNIN